jgi:HPt (histidine-containing phosphotransfer) domain-containing protein
MGERVSGKPVSASLPAALLADLRASFRTEVQNRLPHLEDLADLETARRDAHTIASGAWVVGEPEIARLARAVENELPDGPVAELLTALRDHIRATA